MSYQVNYAGRINRLEWVIRFTDGLAIGFLAASTYQMAQVFGGNWGAYLKALSFDAAVLIFSTAASSSLVRGWIVGILWIALIFVILINMAMNVYYGYDLLAHTKYKMPFVMDFIIQQVDTVDHLKVWMTDAIMPPLILGLALSKKIFNSQIGKYEKKIEERERLAARLASQGVVPAKETTDEETD